MANDNETVEQVYEEMKEVTGIRRFIDSHYCNHCGDQIDGEGSALDVYADRFLSAHKREISGLKGERKGILKANESLAADNTRLRDELAAKDSEIVKLRALVGELADALDGFRCAPCDSCMLNRCPGIEKCKETKATIELVAKAKEVLNG